MSTKLREHLDWSVDTEMGEKQPLNYMNHRNKRFVNLHGIAAVELPKEFNDYTLFHENGKAYVIPLTYKKEKIHHSVTDDEQVVV